VFFAKHESESYPVTLDGGGWTYACTVRDSKWRPPGRPLSYLSKRSTQPAIMAKGRSS
jgi:hypothetical protein